MISRARAAREVLAGKWKIDLLYLLARGVHRYSRLYDNLTGASKKMVTDSLRALERDGFVQRKLCRSPRAGRVLPHSPRLGRH